MSEKHPSDVLGSLPRSRPQRRSAKRPARQPARPQPPQPQGAPEARRGSPGALPTGVEVLGTAIGAATELAEIALSAGVRAIRHALANIPRP